MDLSLIKQIHRLNPWLEQPEQPILDQKKYIPRLQAELLLKPEWDSLWTILVGPRQAGKTTLGKYLCQQLIGQKRFHHLLYLNCDYLDIRNWLKDTNFIEEAFKQFQLTQPILFIDEVQRLESPGLLLKTIVDLKLPIKLIASGSSQLEIKSKVQEYLTGRHLEAIVLPLGLNEIGNEYPLAERLIYGAYPSIVRASTKQILLAQLYQDYISKDIIEILKVGKPDVMQKLVTLLAHSSGQLVNYQQLALDCRVSIPTIQNYLAILEQTYVTQVIKPFVGNKRSEITSNPIYYFIDNGFRNQALRNFASLDHRADNGLLVQGFVFQEIRKWQVEYFRDFSIGYWRTKMGAEVDFVLHKNPETILPIEVKYRTFRKPQISRGFRSFIEAYQPRVGIVVTKALLAEEIIEGCKLHFIPLERLIDIDKILQHWDR